MAKKAAPARPSVQLFLADPNNTPVEDLAKLQKGEDEFGPRESPLVKSILNAIHSEEDKIQRIAFERDPTQNNEYAAIYQQKVRLIPDYLLKRISIQDDLVAAILNARSNHVAPFGRPRPDRFSNGFEVKPKDGILDKATKEEKDELNKRIADFEKILYTCGKTSNVKEEDRMTLPKFLAMQTRNGLCLGRFATEFIYAEDENNEKGFHSFRPIDAGTIYRAAPYKTSVQSVRDQARKLLEQMLNEKFEAEKQENDEYAWIQVIDGKPVQAFTSDECKVHNCYPVTDIELRGYPLTPLDTVIAAVTTHINITTHNKLFFQSGRAARGMVVIQSDDADPKTVAAIRQQFNANINNVQNSWRMPVFSVPKDSNVQFQAIETQGRDMEFQYLSDTNARVILSAFQMSPEELPGYAHLSRGTNNQALSESNNEYQLEAHRDVGIRPLLSHFEDFLNNIVFPKLDPKLAELCEIKLVGLDAETAEKESVRLSQDAPIHMTYDEILTKVEKDPIGKEFGGEFPLNPQYQMILDKYLTVGMIVEKFFGVQNAAKDPSLQYIRDPFWFQFQQLQMQAQQMQMQQQQMAMQQQQAAASGQAPPGQDGGGDDGGGDDGGGGGKKPPQDDGGEEGEQPQGQQEEQESDLTNGLDQLQSVLGKAENQLPPSKRRLLAQQKATVKKFMDGWEEDAKKALEEVMAVASQHAPKKRS